MSAQRSAHRRHAQAIAQRGLFDGSSTSTTSDFWDWLFPPHTTSSSSTTSTSTTSSTSTSLTLQTTLPSDPFSTSLPPTTSTTSSSTTPTPTPTPPTSTHKSTVVVTISKPATNVGAAATNSTTPSGGSKAGAIVGGIGATLLGIAVICALVAFFLRRWRRRRDDANAFNASSFRRSAMLMPDPPTHDDTVAAGFNPRPPPLMTERTPTTFGNMYGNPGPYGAQNHYLPSPSSANPFIPNHPYTQSPFSPTDPPADPFKDLPPPVLTRNSVGTASNISGVSIDHGQAAAQYVELNRSPSYARAHYVEVPKKQQAEQPVPVSQDESEEDIPPPVPQKDTSATTRTSIASQSEELTDDLDFPAPPSPALTIGSKYGVSITPPVLPEISLRDSGYSFPSPAIISQFPSGVPSLVTSSEQTLTLTNSAPSFPVTPSPMASSFTLSPGAAQKDFGAESKLTVPPPAQPAPSKRPETIYDMDDAYGGI